MSAPPKWGAWSVRRSVARKMYDCGECGHLILTGDSYTRRYGRMGESMRAWMFRMCERCEAKWAHGASA